ncbi:hypothetical protein ABID69_003633, partial [Stenotrophomonas sp. PvP087]
PAAGRQHGQCRPAAGTTAGPYDQSYENSTLRLSGSYSISTASAPVAQRIV